MSGMRLEEAGFSNRTYNCLRRYGITTIDQLLNISTLELSKARNIGAKTIKEIEDYKRQYLDHDADEDIASIGLKRLVIHRAFPEYYGVDISNMQFRDFYGYYKDDIDIKDLFFSSKTTRCLSNAKLETIGAVANLEYDSFLNIFNDNKCIKEVIDYISMNTKVYVIDEKVQHSQVNGHAF